MTGAVVRALGPDDHDWKLDVLRLGSGSTVVARLGEAVDAAPLPGFRVDLDGVAVGLATCRHIGDEVEIVTMQALLPGRGVGRALLGAIRDRAVELGATRLWLVITNDNVRAVDVYQRWGMQLARVVHEGVVASRAVDPTIPLEVAGVAVRHELVLEHRVRR